MTIEEATQKRDELIIEQRHINQSIRILSGDSIVHNAGTKMAIGQYNRRLGAIDDELRTLAAAVDIPVDGAEDLVIDEPEVDTEETVTDTQAEPAQEEAPKSELEKLAETLIGSLSPTDLRILEQLAAAVVK